METPKNIDLFIEMYRTISGLNKTQIRSLGLNHPSNINIELDPLFHIHNSYCLINITGPVDTIFLPSNYEIVDRNSWCDKLELIDLDKPYLCFTYFFRYGETVVAININSDHKFNLDNEPIITTGFSKKSIN